VLSICLCRFDIFFLSVVILSYERGCWYYWVYVLYFFVGVCLILMMGENLQNYIYRWSCCFLFNQARLLYKNNKKCFLHKFTLFGPKNVKKQLKMTKLINWSPEIFSGGPMRSVLSVRACIRPCVRPDDNGKTNERIFMKFGI